MEEMRSFGYVCPACGNAVLGERSLFALNASNVELSCECGKSSLLVENLDGLSFRLHVPCGVCGETHRAECAPEGVLGGKGVGLACPGSKQLCCFVGPRERVEKSALELETLCRKKKEKSEETEAFLDSVIMYEVLSELKEIAARPEGIACGCGSMRYSMEIRPAAVDLICADCGAKLRIGAASDEDLDALCCRMKLRIPGGQG